MTQSKQPTEIKLGNRQSPVRFHFLYAHEPRVEKDDAGQEKEPSYQTMVLVPKDGPWKAQMDAAMRAAAAASPDTKNSSYDALDLVVRDGDDPKEQAKKAEKGDASYLKGNYFFNCKSKHRPEVVSGRNTAGPGEKPKFERLTEDQIKWGDKGSIMVRFYGYKVKGKCGIAASMGNIQKLADGEPLGNRRSADDQFDADEEDDLLK